MSRTIENVVCLSTAVRQEAAQAERAGEPLTQAMVDALERLRAQGIEPTRAALLVRSAYRWYGPGEEADAYIAAHLPVAR